MLDQTRAQVKLYTFITQFSYYPVTPWNSCNFLFTDGISYMA